MSHRTPENDQRYNEPLVQTSKFAVALTVDPSNFANEQ